MFDADVSLYPLKMSPVFKQYIWGGEKLKKMYGKNTPVGTVAESWEVSCHPEGLSTIANGVFAGMTLNDAAARLGFDMFGTATNIDDGFPLMLKLLDAKDNLSVQVHPGDEYAFANENGSKGKTELWYILDCDEGARIVYGFKPGIEKEKFAAAITDGTSEDILNYIDVLPGDVFFIPSGTVHAIGAGMVVAEIQQSSNSTYRVFDYNRVGADDKRRELHIKKALDVADVSCAVGREKVVAAPHMEGENTRTRYVSCKYFVFEKINVVHSIEEKTSDTLNILLFIHGTGTVNGEKFKPGDAFVIPAGMDCYSINGRCEVLKFFTATQG